MRRPVASIRHQDMRHLGAATRAAVGTGTTNLWWLPTTALRWLSAALWRLSTAGLWWLSTPAPAPARDGGEWPAALDLREFDTGCRPALDAAADGGWPRQLRGLSL